MKNEILLISVVATLLVFGTVMLAGATATDGYPCPTVDGVIPTYYAGNDPACTYVVPEGSYAVSFKLDSPSIAGSFDIKDTEENVIGTFHYSAPYMLTDDTTDCPDNIGAWAFDWYVTGGTYTGIINNKAGNGYLQYNYIMAFAEWDGDEGLYGPRTSDSSSPWAGISHFTFCGYFTPEDGGTQEVLEVRKTVDTSYTRTHLWDIDKSVDTENGYEHEGYPKIWLYTDGSGDETATWTVDVTYEGSTDSDFIVSGEIIIENTGSTDAVITDIDDLLAGTSIDVSCVTFPYTLPAGGTLTCTYIESVTSMIDGYNEVTVTTEEGAYSANPVEIIWGDPTTEVNDEVTVVDNVYGDLGTVTAPDGTTFSYTENFAWEDYKDGDQVDYRFDNIATIVETGQYDDATLLVNVQPKVTVTKTAETSYIRTHLWDIAKYVDTEDGWEHNGYPKIWLYTDGSGDETATWTVDVTYEGSTDSDFIVSGDIEIVNYGPGDVEITGVEDLLAGTLIDISCMTFPYTLPAGETLTCTYTENVDGKIVGSNVVTVTTSPGDWPDLDAFEYESSADIIWGDPTTEVNDEVNIEDLSDLFGYVPLGTVTAPDDATFTYTKDFAWADYGEDSCGDYTYDNTATIVETEQSASATLLVNVQCYDYETAYAKGNPAKCFIDNGFANWGWTNPITTGTYTWPLWAAAGQCDTSKGTLVGTVTVMYDSNGYVTATYNVDSPYLLKETHVYAGYTMFPMKKGIPTVAPGAYYNNGPFVGPIYVIAHAVVGIPDPDFGPQPPV